MLNNECHAIFCVTLYICATRQIPSSDPKFHQPLIVEGVGKSTRASFAILNRGCLFRMGLFIILYVVRAPLIVSGQGLLFTI
jgi:hypothetical protein